MSNGLSRAYPYSHSIRYIIVSAIVYRYFRGFDNVQRSVIVTVLRWIFHVSKYPHFMLDIGLVQKRHTVALHITFSTYHINKYKNL